MRRPGGPDGGRDTRGGFSLYVHVPFCVKRCRYCEFASEVVTREGVRRYLDALALEAERSPFRGAAPATVYVGGGTPTSLSDAELAELFGVLCGAFCLDRADGVADGGACRGEFTVEANPGTVDAKRLSALRDLGANRLSLGVQSFDDERLRLLGRAHTAREAEEAFLAAREAGFTNVSLDLIFAVPGFKSAPSASRPPLPDVGPKQTLEDARSDAARAVALSPEHVSLYGLTCEEGTPLRRMRDEGELEPVPEELERAMYLGIIDDLERAGHVHYEISNFARPGRESRHNTAYWLGGEYVGLGPSAASFTGGERRTNARSLGEYASRLARGEDAATFRERLPPERSAREAAVLGLRMRAGVDLVEFEERTGFSLDGLLDDLPDGRGARLFAGGWLERVVQDRAATSARCGSASGGVSRASRLPPGPPSRPAEEEARSRRSRRRDVTERVDDPGDGRERVRLTRKALPVADAVLAEIV